MKELIGLFCLFIMFICLGFTFYYLWQVSQDLITIGFNSPDLAYNLGNYIKFLISVVISSIFVKLIFMDLK